MITAIEARALAFVPQYERRIKAAAEEGKLYIVATFMDKASAMIIRTKLIDNGFVCSKINDRDGRDGRDFDFKVSWE